MASIWNAASYTHTGRRRSNQDAVVVTKLSGGREVVAIADGMGGHSAGEVASARALETLVAELRGSDDLRAAVRAANAAVYAEGSRNPGWQGMGTTVVALLRTGNTYHIANVGDSRAYRIDAQAIAQLTDDHSFVAEALRGGAMSPEQAAVSPWRNALTRAVGTDAEVEVDLFGPFAVDEPHAVLLCSDGLYKPLPAESLHNYVLATEDVEAAVRALAALAFRRGSDDNITVAAVEFGSLGRLSLEVTLPVPISRQILAASTTGAVPPPDSNGRGSGG